MAEEHPCPRKIREQWVVKDLPLWALENLPEGWVKVTHESGFPLFLHKETQVVTLSRPYFLGNVNARTHKVPISAIPCLFYDQILKNETTNEQSQENHLTSTEFREYCKRKFEFERLEIPYFTKLIDKRKYLDEEKRKDQQIPADCSHILFAKKLKLECPSKEINETTAKVKVFKAKPPLVCLYEHCSRVLKQNIIYEPVDPPQSNTRLFAYRAKIGDRFLGYGHGRNKKMARIECAKAALDELGVKYSEDRELAIAMEPPAMVREDKTNCLKLAAMDKIGSFRPTDPNIHRLSLEIKCPTPWTILKTEAEYDFFSERMIETYFENHYTGVVVRIKYREFEETVKGSDKSEAESLAAQRILTALHPHFNTWNDFLELHATIQKHYPPVHPDLVGISFNQTNPSTKVLDFIHEQLRKLEHPTPQHDRNQNYYRLKN